MKLVIGCLIAAVVLIGCGNSDSSTEASTTKKPVQMPTAVGVTAGQSGTGTTSGASTGY